MNKCRGEGTRPARRELLTVICSLIPHTNRCFVISCLELCSALSNAHNKLIMVLPPVEFDLRQLIVCTICHVLT